MTRRRLDLELVRRGLVGSRSEAQERIESGVVTVGVFAHQKASVCLLGTADGVRTLTF